MKINSNQTKKNTKRTEISVKFANTIFLIALLFFILIIILAIYKTFQPFSVFNHLMLAFISLPLAALFFLGFFLRNPLKVNLSLLIVSMFFTVYIFEFFLDTLLIQNNYEEPNTKPSSSSFDKRKVMDVVSDLNKKGDTSFPYIGPLLFINSNGLKSKNDKIYPLGGIPKVTTVFCNESGFWAIHKSDEHGFNNPKGLYKKNKIEILLIGDSMADGACVNNDDSISSVIRKSGFKILNLSRGGNGPLIELASLMEYGHPLKPKIVLWQFYENDFRELEREINSPILKKYLELDGFSQNLILRSNEIEKSLKNYFRKSLSKVDIIEDNPFKILQRKVFRIIKLSNIRTRLDLTPKPNPYLFKKILSKAEESVSSWGGSLYFIYIPSNSEISQEYNSFRKIVLTTVKDLQIPIINIKNEVIDSHPDPLSLFPQRQSKSHYNKQGYKLISEAIIKRLTSDININLD